MDLKDAHKGYEYQDLLSALFIVEQLLNDKESDFLIDKKESSNDKFDDITIITNDKVIKKQIKYSDSKSLEKVDFSSDRCDLALDELFKSWKEIDRTNDIDLRICLAWEYKYDSDIDFFKEIECEEFYKNENVKYYKIDIDKIWKDNSEPVSTWRRLRKKADEENIDREEFAEFLDNLIVEVNLPKASLDINNPGPLEQLVILKLKKLGIGKYPNYLKAVEDVLLNLTHLVKRARTKEKSFSNKDVIYQLGLKKNFGSIEQHFFIDKDLNVVIKNKYEKFFNFVTSNKKTLLMGEPGSGKSWFLQNFIEYLKDKNINIIQHYCYTKLNDEYETDRIKTNIFLGNLINDIVKAYPHLGERKNTKYGVDVEELQNLLNNIEEKTVLIIDGLDHINRIYNMHQKILKEIDTEIIKIISELNFPENIIVILASQPIRTINNLPSKGFKKYDFPPWNIIEVKELLSKNNLENKVFNNNKQLSTLLLEKSNGNPLYLTYLINELKTYSLPMLSMKLINGLPIYNTNLSNYYSYILDKTNNSEKVAQILSGSPFYLTKQELYEITELGQFVDDTLDTMQSVLKHNNFSGGYAIYHESFRRYILDLLKEKGVNLNKTIYNELIEWLKKKEFYKNKKSYLYLLILLFESERYDEIINYCNKEFVLNSIYYGNNIKSLKKNFEILIKTSCVMKDYENLIVCTELSNMIYSFEYSFDENSQLYFKGIGIIHGFEYLKEMLLFEGSKALETIDGLKICYLCSVNGIIPDWNPYIKSLIKMKISKNIQENDYEKFKYYICGFLDMGYDIKPTILKRNNKSDYVYRRIIIDEYYRRDSLEDLKSIINTINDNEFWKESISNYFGSSDFDESMISSIFENLRNVKTYSEDTASSLFFYIHNIKWLIENKKNELEIFIDSIKERNWFYNWLIFIAEVNKVILENNKENDQFEADLVNAYSWLIKDTDQFKGEPRTCDLFWYENLIYQTIKMPMEYIKSKEIWEKILEIVKVMSYETMTSIRGTTNGPLTTDKLLELLVEITEENNIKKILEIFDEKIGNENKYRNYSYLADYSIKHAIILSKASENEKAYNEFKKGVKYLLSYSFHKDRTFSRLLDSVECTYKVDKEKGLENIMKLKPLADAVVYHTDGDETKTYQLEWFEILLNVDIDLALTYLKKELVSFECHWIFEDSLVSLLIKIGSQFSPILENAIFKTLPNNISEKFIEAYVKNIECVFEGNFLLQARTSVIELINRFEMEDEVYLSDEIIDRLKKLCENFDIDFKPPISSKNIRKRKENKNISRLSFSKYTNEGLLDHIKKEGIRESDSQGLYYYLNSFENLNEETKIFLSSLIEICLDKRINDSTSEVFIKIVDNLDLNDEIMSFIYIHIFLIQRDGWYRRFTETIFFKKAYECNSQIAEQHFFEYVYNNLYIADYSLAVGNQIIKALASVGDQNILCYWNKLFEIINFRLPEQSDFDWCSTIKMANSFDREEKLLSLLLTRLKYGEANRYKWITSELDYLFKDENIRRKFAKPFNQFLIEKDKYMDYALIIILELMIKHFSYKELSDLNIKETLEAIYQTDKCIIDYLIRKLLRKRKNRIYLEYKNNNFFNEKRLNGSTDTDILKNIDPRLSLLEENGLNISNIVDNYIKKTSDKKLQKKYNEILYSRKYSVIAPNTYFYDLLTDFMGKEVENYLNNYAGSPDIDKIEEENYNVVLDDMNLTIAQNNSIIQRPKDLDYPEDLEDSINEINISEWVRIAHIEKWFYNINEYGEKILESGKNITVISGVGFELDDNPFPLLILKDKYRLFDENNNENYNLGYLTKLKRLVISNIKIYSNLFLTYKTKRYLGIRGDILNLLGIKMIENEKGIVGITDKKQVVLKYSRWDTNFLDDNCEIPYLIGSQLLMKKNEFIELCNLVKKKPYLYIRKIDDW